MGSSVWARRRQLHHQTAQRWFETSNLPVAERRQPGGTIPGEDLPRAAKAALYRPGLGA
jgi:predicted site-specific integrase-resolvase